MNSIVLDKTGTITEGKPEVTDLQFVPETDEALGRSVLLAIEEQSEHPLAEAVVRKLKEENTTALPIPRIESITGTGVMAAYNGRNWLVGNKTHERLRRTYPRRCRSYHALLQQQAKTVVLLQAAK